MTKIVITIEVEGAATVSVGQSTSAPLEELPPVSAPAPANGGDGCPVHKVAWKTVPAGISSKTGKPYDAFRACPERGCNERPR